MNANFLLNEGFWESLKDIKCFPENGHWHSIDGGPCFVVDDTVYWATGEVSPNRGVCRMMKMDSGEDYSKWSDEKRAEVWAETLRKREEYETERCERQKAQDILIESARAKLTEEEFDAVFESGRDY